MPFVEFGLNTNYVRHQTINLGPPLFPLFPLTCALRKNPSAEVDLSSMPTACWNCPCWNLYSAIATVPLSWHCWSLSGCRKRNYSVNIHWLPPGVTTHWISYFCSFNLINQTCLNVLVRMEIFKKNKFYVLNKITKKSTGQAPLPELVWHRKERMASVALGQLDSWKRTPESTSLHNIH